MKDAQTRPGLEMEMFHGKDGWRLRLVETGNHTKLLVSESYFSKFNAQRASRKLGFEPVEVSD